MTIRSNKNAFRARVVFPTALCLTVVFIALCGNGWVALALFLIFGIILADHWAIIFRKFLLDEFGCTICLGKHRWRYSWEELQLKRIESSHLPLPLGGFFFSVKKVRKSTISDPQYYHRFLHPFYHINQPFGRYASAQIGMKECRQTTAFLVEYS